MALYYLKINHNATNYSGFQHQKLITINARHILLNKKKKENMIIYTDLKIKAGLIYT
jgi:hypothetical protein